jgi:hypothetical protein
MLITLAVQSRTHIALNGSDPTLSVGHGKDFLCYPLVIKKRFNGVSDPSLMNVTECLIKLN